MYAEDSVHDGSKGIHTMEPRMALTASYHMGNGYELKSVWSDNES
jgi:hypothetical protein